jgi:hypothetical protein
MRKWTTMILAGTVAFGAVLSTAALAGENCCASKASAMKVSTKSGASCTSVETASMSGACGTKSAFAGIFKDAPGTKTEYVKVDGGVALVVTASSNEYVPTVQKAFLGHLDGMKEKTSTGAACSYSGAKAPKVSTASAASCGSKAEKVDMASAIDCPEWMKVLCGAVCNVEKTATGVKVTWTAPEKEQIHQLQAAGEKFQAELAQL